MASCSRPYPIPKEEMETESPGIETVFLLLKMETIPLPLTCHFDVFLLASVTCAGVKIAIITAAATIVMIH